MTEREAEGYRDVLHRRKEVIVVLLTTKFYSYFLRWSMEKYC